MKCIPLTAALFLVIGLATAHAEERLLPAELCASYICIEAETGLILSEANADAIRPPASMVKLLMLYMLSEGLESGKWLPETPVEASAHAQLMGGTQVYLKAGEQHTLLNLAMASAVASANDATMALAEGLWGSEEAYLAAMNAQAKALGMKNSHFYSVHGLPPDPGNPFDETTARDMAVLAQACVKKPLIMEWVRHSEYAFRPGETPKPNTNKLMNWMPECDGLKTGYIRAAGFCVTATAVRDGIRLITVVMGCPSNTQRFRAAQTVLEAGFATVRKVKVLEKGEPLHRPIQIANSPLREMRPLAEDDLWVVAKQDEINDIRLVIMLPERLYAPLQSGAGLGRVQAVVGDQTRGEVNVAAPTDVPEAGWRWKLIHGARDAETQQGG